MYTLHQLQKALKEAREAQYQAAHKASELEKLIRRLQSDKRAPVHH